MEASGFLKSLLRLTLTDTLISALVHAPVPGTGVVETMYFIQLVKFKKKVSRDLIAGNLKQIEAEEKAGVKTLSIYWTLGPYDAIVTIEAPDEKAAMKTALVREDWADAVTLVAIPAVEARKLVE